MRRFLFLKLFIICCLSFSLVSCGGGDDEPITNIPNTGNNDDNKDNNDDNNDNNDDNNDNNKDDSETNNGTDDNNDNNKDDNNNEDNNEDPVPASISLTVTDLNVNSEGGEFQTIVTSSGDWLLKGSAEWCKPSIIEGNSGDTVTFTITQNNTYQERVAYFTFSCDLAWIDFTVVQEGMDRTGMDMGVNGWDDDGDDLGGTVN